MVAPVVLISPAMAVSSRFYRPLVGAFESHGWDAVALPRRGFEPDGVVASRSADWGYDDEIDDIAVAVATARAEQPDRPVVLLGHSLGAQMGAGHELHRDPCDGFVAVGASVPHYRHYPHRGIPLRLLGMTVPVATRVRGHLPPPFFGAPGARTLMREWARFVRTGRPPFDVPRHVGTPTLVVRLEGDVYAVPGATDDFIDRFVDRAALTEWIYPASDVPEGGSTHHVLWVRTPEPVVDRIVAWWNTVRRTPRPAGTSR